MRFPTTYMCSLMNQARHEAFGIEAAKLVVKTLPTNWPKEVVFQILNTHTHGLRKNQD
jgi:hypothetical protein